MTRYTHLSAGERDQLARELYCAWIDATPAEVREIMKGSLLERVMERWRRVADAAAGQKPALTQPKAENAPQRAPAAPKVQLGARYEKAPPVQAIIANGRQWCGQCDHSVTNGEAKACRKAFCKAVVA